MALTTGGKIEKTNYDAKKADAITSINTVGTTWTWSNTVSVGSLVAYNQVKELRDASDKAYDLINPGCVTHCGAVYSSNYSNYSNYEGNYWSDYSNSCDSHNNDNLEYSNSAMYSPDCAHDYFDGCVDSPACAPDCVSN